MSLTGMDVRQFRKCLGRWPTGVTVITTLDETGHPRGLAINSFASLSLDPPLVVWSLAKTAKSFAAFAGKREFVVHVIADRQHGLVERFARSGGSKFDGLEVAVTNRGTPILRGATATIICEHFEQYDGGDHVLIVGRVRSFEEGNEPALVFLEGQLRIACEVPRLACESQRDAALVVVGDELVSGSVVDVNGPHLSRRLKDLGVVVQEIRLVRDDVQSIAMTVRLLARLRRWVFVVGGLGDTHDDVTAMGIATAFGLDLTPNDGALEALRGHYAPDTIPESRIEGAKLPRNCHALPDLIGGACGFIIENVIALPGYPSVAAHLFESVAGTLDGGSKPFEASLKAALLEHEIAQPLRDLQSRYADVQIGCYPYFGSLSAGVNLVLRSESADSLAACKADIAKLLLEKSGAKNAPVVARLSQSG